MAAASSSTVWDVQPGAGAAEPGAAAVTVVENDETVLRVAFYNVGMQQSALDSREADRAKQRCRALAHDIAEGFKSITWKFFACAGWENTRSALSAART